MARLTCAPSYTCQFHNVRVEHLSFDNDLSSDGFKPLASAFAGSSSLMTWNFTLPSGTNFIKNSSFSSIILAALDLLLCTL